VLLAGRPFKIRREFLDDVPKICLWIASPACARRC
jgi:hypothetical protein